MTHHLVAAKISRPDNLSGEEVEKLGKPAKEKNGGIQVTNHAVNRFRQRCSNHPLAKKGTAGDVQRAIRKLVRKGDVLPHDGLQSTEMIVAIGYFAPKLGLQRMMVLLVVDRRNSRSWAVLTFLTPEMFVSGRKLREFL